jgi:hypothetical protein
MVYRQSNLKACAPAAPARGGKSLKRFSAQRVKHALGGRRVFQSAVFKNALKRRHPQELKRGMQRPSDSAYATPLGIPCHLSPFTFHLFISPRAGNPGRGCLIAVTEAWQFRVEISDCFDVVFIQVGLSD